MVSGEGSSLAAAGGPLASGCSVQVSMGVLVGGAWGEGGGPTLPPLTWRVYPAECAQSHKTAHMDTGARLLWNVPTDAKQNLSWSSEMNGVTSVDGSLQRWTCAWGGF